MTERAAFPGLTILLLVLGLVSCKEAQSPSSTTSLEESARSAFRASATSNEEERLALIYVEEKLARDVYRRLSNSSGHQVFAHIAECEQRHMDYVESIIHDRGGALKTEDRTGAFED